jgi:hypothetical protein
VHVGSCPLNDVDGCNYHVLHGCVGDDGDDGVDGNDGGDVVDEDGCLDM